MKYFMQKTYLALLLALLISTLCSAQKKVIFEQMRCFSMQGPSMQYLQNPENQQQIAHQIYQTLLNEQNLVLLDSTKVPVTLIDESELLNKLIAKGIHPDTELLHLYIDCIETSPTSFFNQNAKQVNDSDLIRRSVSVLQLNYHILNYRNKIVAENKVSVSMAINTAPAIGIPYTKLAVDNKYLTLSTTSAGFTETIKKSIPFLFNSVKSSSLIEVKVPPAFIYNNFISKESYRTGRILIPVFQKSTWNYVLPDGEQTIRYAEKKAYPVSLINKAETDNPYKNMLNQSNEFKNKSASDYFVFKNDIRDVLNNRNYQTNLVASITTYDLGGPTISAINKNINVLLREKDTMAVFSLNQEPSFKDSAVLWFHQVYNGIDSSSLFTIQIDTFPYPFYTSMRITGFFHKQPFSIRMKGPDLEWKEIILNGTPAIWIWGATRPERVLIKDVSLSADVINELFMIAFSLQSVSEDAVVEIPIKKKR